MAVRNLNEVLGNPRLTEKQKNEAIPMFYNITHHYLNAIQDKAVRVGDVYSIVEVIFGRRATDEDVMKLIASGTVGRA